MNIGSISVGFGNFIAALWDAAGPPSKRETSALLSGPNGALRVSIWQQNKVYG